MKNPARKIVLETTTEIQIIIKTSGMVPKTDYTAVSEGTKTGNIYFCFQFRRLSYSLYGIFLSFLCKQIYFYNLLYLVGTYKNKTKDLILLGEVGYTGHMTPLGSARDQILYRYFLL